MPSDPTDLDRLPPHDPAAEQGVLGCLLLDAQQLTGASTGEALEECLRRHVTPSHFYDLRHQVLYATICHMAEAGKPADLVLLSGEMTDAGNLAKIGGLAYLNELCSVVPSAANVGYYLDVVLEKWTLRNVIKVGSSAAAGALDFNGDVRQFVGNFEAEALKLSETHVPTEFRPIPEFLPAYIDAIESRHRGKQEITGLGTPWWYLNNMTCGLQAHELVVIGARPGQGKTAQGIDMIRHQVKLGTPCLFFSAEMNEQQVIERLVAAEAQVDGLKLRNGFWSEQKEADIIDATHRVAAWKHFLIDGRSACTGQDVYIGTRRAIRQHGVKLVVVDYIQLLQSVRKYNTRQEEVAECSTWLRRTAKDLGVAVVALAQLSRESEKDRPGKPPMLSDLRECGQIEQDAHVVAMLFEPKLDEQQYHDMKWLSHHKPDDPKEDGDWATMGCDEIYAKGGGGSVIVNRGWREEFRRMNLMVLKNRSGPGGVCELVFQKRSARFVDAHSPNRVKADKGTLI